MKICIYKGSYSLVKKSGLGMAILHQTEMLEKLGTEVTDKSDSTTDAVHINTVFPNAFFFALSSRIKGKKVVYYGHSTVEDFRSSFKGSNALAPLLKYWLKLCYRLGNIIITPTEYSKKLLTGYGIKKPIYALTNGIDTGYFSKTEERGKTFRKKYGLSDEDKVIISVGHFIERKGILDYIEAARKMPDVKFIWFGYTSPKLIPKKITEAIKSAPENLVFPGYINSEELRDAYCGCDIFCFMSREETEGIVVLEALACSTPTIVRDIPVYGGWLRDGENVYKAADNTAFIDIARKMLDKKLPDLTQAGRVTAEEKSIENTGKKLSEIYEKMFAEQKSTAGGQNI